MTTVVGAIKELMAKMEEKLDELNAKSEERTERLERKLESLIQDEPKRRRGGNKSYEVLILEALVDLGGRGTTDEVCELVQEKKGINFKKHSCTARRANMVSEGWLEDDPDKSIWQITEEGHASLAEVS